MPLIISRSIFEEISQKMLRAKTKPQTPRSFCHISTRRNALLSSPSVVVSSPMRLIQTKSERRKELKKDGKEFMKIILEKNKEEEVVVETTYARNFTQ